MNRKFVSQSGGKSFLDRFRNAFQTILNEVNILELITKTSLNQPINFNSSTSYFYDELVSLNKIDQIYVSCNAACCFLFIF